MPRCQFHDELADDEGVLHDDAKIAEVVKAAKMVRALWDVPCTRENIQRMIDAEHVLRFAVDALGNK